MARTDKLAADLGITLRGMRSHEGMVASRAAQAATPDVVQHLRRVEAREKVVADRVARVLRDLGAPTPRVKPSWLPTPTSVIAAAATATQPLAETLVLEASTLRTLADRARVVRGLAAALDRTSVVDVAEQVIDLYDEYAGWLVETAAAVTVNGDLADLTPTTTQQVGAQIKGVVTAPVRLYGQVADRTATGVEEVTDRARRLVGLGHEKLDDAVDTAAEAVSDAAASVQDAVTPVEASDLPVTRYDSRSAAEAAQALRELRSVDDVSTVLAYEAQHKDRKTVIDAGDKRVAQLTGASS